MKTRLRCRTSQGKYKVMNYVDKTNLEWNTELIEAMELEHVMSQAKHATNPGKLKLTNTNIYLNAKRCSERNTRTQVHQETTRELNSQTSRAEDVCLKNACMNDVHMTSPHNNHDHDHDHDHLHDTTTKGLALWWLITLDESSPQWVPARTPTVHWGRYDGRPWVARSTPHRAKSRTMTEH